MRNSYETADRSMRDSLVDRLRHVDASRARTTRCHSLSTRNPRCEAFTPVRHTSSVTRQRQQSVCYLLIQRVFNTRLIEYEHEENTRQGRWRNGGRTAWRPHSSQQARMTTRAVLVTGGAGYIGSHTCKALARAGYLPVALDNLDRGHKRAVRWGPFIQGDIRDRRLLESTIREHRIDSVVHFAAYAYAAKCTKIGRAHV